MKTDKPKAKQIVGVQAISRKTGKSLHRTYYNTTIKAVHEVLRIVAQNGGLRWLRAMAKRNG